MDSDRVVGTAKNLFGKAEKAVGDAGGSARTSAQGAAHEAEGMVQNAFGQAKDTVREAASAAGDMVTETVQDRPASAVLLAGLIGMAIGFVLAKGSQPPRQQRYWDRYAR